MEKVGLISRVERRDPYGGNKSNEYAFDGLRAKAEPHAKEVLQEREDRKRVKSERSKPRLRVVG